MEQVLHVGGMSRRAALVSALGVTALLTAGAATPTSEAAAHATNGGLLLIGDSWAAGLHADPSRALGQVAAEILAMDAQIDAVSGTGYVDTAGHQNYLQRARTATGSPRLIVVQGGSNDQNEDVHDLATNAHDTFAVLQERFPHARLLILGPGPDPAPVTDRQRAVDTTLQSVTQSMGLHYASMLQRNWIPEALIDSVIDAGNAHPTVSGQSYLGTRLAASVRLIHPDLFA